MRRFAIVWPILLALFGGGALALRLTVFRLSQTAADPARYDGTQAMAARLKEAAAREDRDRNALTRVPAYALLVRYFAEIETPPDERSRILLAARAAERLLQLGETERAIAGFLEVRAQSTAQPKLFDREFQRSLARELAIAWLRLGEQQNCQALHGPDSCLYPLTGSGVHTQKEGARHAVEEYTAILAEHPDDVTARWLLTLAYAALGEPEHIPAEWRLALPEPAGPFPRFPQVAAQAGLDVEGLSGSTVAEDFDGDGDLDVLVSRFALDGELRYFRNDAGRFVDATDEAGLTGITGGLHLMQTDYDNDGRPDVLVPRGAWAGEDGRLPLSLLHNEGSGHFRDVTVKAGLLAFHPSQTAVWADFDGDGWVDLFVGRESFTLDSFYNYLRFAIDARREHPQGTPSFQRHPCALYRNNHDGTFTDVSAGSGADQVGFWKGVAAGDIDNDGRIDLYLSSYLEPNVLLHNDGGFHFRDVTAHAGVAEPIFSFPAFFFDYDNDGWLDLFVGDAPTELGIYDGAARVVSSWMGIPPPENRTKITSLLYHNEHDGTFRDVSAQAGVAKTMIPMGSSWGDLDNDGWPDFYLGTGNPSYEGLVPNRMFRNLDGRGFEEVTLRGGFGHLQKGHGLTFADLDEDGDQDVFVIHGGAFTGDRGHSALFENPGFGNHWLKLTLEGRTANRAAIGARVRVTVATAAGDRQLYSVVGAPGSFGSQPFRRELGLGRALAVRAIEVEWPGGRPQRFGPVAMDHAFRLIEGDPRPKPITVGPYTLGGAAPK